MIERMALGILATRSGTGIDTLLINTGSVSWTVSVHDAFGATTDIRIASVFGYALTRSDAIAFLAHGIYAARRRIAWFRRWVIGCRKEIQIKVLKVYNGSKNRNKHLKVGVYV